MVIQKLSRSQLGRQCTSFYAYFFYQKVIRIFAHVNSFFPLLMFTNAFKRQNYLHAHGFLAFHLIKEPRLCVTQGIEWFGWIDEWFKLRQDSRRILEFSCQKREFMYLVNLRPRPELPAHRHYIPRIKQRFFHQLRIFGKKLRINF